MPKLTTERQTELLSKLDDRLSSIIQQANEARNCQGNPDKVSDLLSDIEMDVREAHKINNILAMAS